MPPDRKYKPACLNCRRTILPGYRIYGAGTYCCRECSEEHKLRKSTGPRPATRILFRCEQCHCEQLILASDADGKKYCSVKCRGAARSAKNAERKPRQPPESVTCEYCHETKIFPASEARGRKFCDKKCQRLHYRQERAIAWEVEPRKTPEPKWDFRGEDEPNIPASDGRRYSW